MLRPPTHGPVVRILPSPSVRRLNLARERLSRRPGLPPSAMLDLGALARRVRGRGGPAS